jgi:polysaccharide pyruvyl transferase WcaK-like protein
MGVGAGPITTDEGKRIYRKLLINSKKILVRDKNSKKLLNNLYPNIKIEVMPDFALAIETKNILKEKRRNILLINLAAVYAKGWPIVNERKFNSYIKNFVDIIETIYKKDNFTKVVLFYSNYPLDKKGGEEFLKLIDKNIKVIHIDKRLSVKNIIKLANSAKLTIVTRLHAGILSHLGGSEIAAISYQPKVKDIFLDYFITDAIFDIEFGNKKTVLSQILNNKIKSEQKNFKKEINNILKNTIEDLG